MVEGTGGVEGAYILTADRYWPWNGEHTDRADRIWNRMDATLRLPLLVYCEGDRAVNAGVHDAVTYVRKRIAPWTVLFFVLILVKLHLVFLWTGNRRALLGEGRRYWRKAKRWYWAYASLREFFRTSGTRVVFYHGEFDAWGLAVARACRDSGVVPIAWQHGIIPPGYDQYRLTKSDKQHLALPTRLFVWSDSAREVAQDLLGDRIPISVAGHGRIQTPYEEFRARDVFRYLVCPSTVDYERYMGFFRANLPNLRGDQRLMLRPHPLRVVDVQLRDALPISSGNVHASLSLTSCVVLSSGTLAIEALRMQIPVVVVEELSEKHNRPYRREMPGLFIRRTYWDAIRLVDQLEANRIELDRSQFHQTARHFAKDVDSEMVANTIAEVTAP